MGIRCRVCKSWRYYRGGSKVTGGVGVYIDISCEGCFVVVG